MPAAIFTGNSPDHTLSNNDLTVVTTSSGTLQACLTSAELASGKHYWEVEIDAGGSSNDNFIGVSGPLENYWDDYPGEKSTGASYRGSDGYLNNNGGSAFGDTFTTGDIIGVAYDADTGKIWFSKNGTWQDSGDPANGTNPAATLSETSVIPAVCVRYDDQQVTLISDSADLNYTPPSGFTGGIDSNPHRIFFSDGTSRHEDMVSASSQYSGSYSPDHAFDGTHIDSSGDRWLSSNGACDKDDPNECTDTWYQWNFGESRSFDAIALGGVISYASNVGFPKNCTIKVSSTGAFSGEETTIGDISFSRPADMTVFTDFEEFPSVATGQYLRMYINDITPGSTQSNNWVGLGEIRLMEYFSDYDTGGGDDSSSSSFGGSAASSGGGASPFPVVRQIVNLQYSLMASVSNIVNLLYGIKLANIVNLLYGNTPVIRQRVVLPYGDYARLVRIVSLRYGDTAQFRSIVDLIYGIQQDIRQIVDLKYHITEEELRNIVEVKYDLRVYDEWRKIVDLIYAVASGEALEEVTTLSFTTDDGYVLDPFHVNIEKEEGKGFDIAFKTYWETDYEACMPPLTADPSDHTVVQITVNSDVYTVVVEEREIIREKPRKTYEITMRSQLFLLDAPYAATVSEELTGMAQTIVEYLVAKEITATVTWTMVNWYIPAGVLVAADETPLSIIQKIVQAGGGVLEADKSGNVVCRPKYPVNIPDYPTETPGSYLTEQDNFYAVSSQTMRKPGFNNFFISDQTPSADGLEIDTRDISATTKEVRVFQIPWAGDTIRLQTSGGSHVRTTENGIQTELITEELVEIVDGQGQSEFPIYTLVSAEYAETNLGTVSTQEDGTVSTTTKHNTLIKLTYRTKFHKFTVVDSRIETVQFWPEIV